MYYLETRIERKLSYNYLWLISYVSDRSKNNVKKIFWREFHRFYFCPKYRRRGSVFSTSLKLRIILGAILSDRKDFQIKTGYLKLATYTRSSLVCWHIHTFIHVECAKTQVVDYYLTRLRLRLTRVKDG